LTSFQKDNQTDSVVKKFLEDQRLKEKSISSAKFGEQKKIPELSFNFIKKIIFVQNSSL
jgi:hypothetical protein